MAALIPAGGLLLETNKTTPDTATISVSGFSAVASWVYSLSPVGVSPADAEGKNFVFTPAGMAFNVSYISEIDLFPFGFIDYLDQNREQFRANTFEDLPEPENSPKIVLMREDAKDLLEWNLTVTAIGFAPGSPPPPATASETFTLRILANYDVSRDKLTEVINARRSF